MVFCCQNTSVRYQYCMASAVGFHPCETSRSTISIGVELGGVLRPHLLKGLTVIYEGKLL